MAERNGIFVTYTADDEMPDCLNCDNCDSEYNCSNFCGAEYGWFGYRRTVREYTEENKEEPEPVDDYYYSDGMHW